MPKQFRTAKGLERRSSPTLKRKTTSRVTLKALKTLLKPKRRTLAHRASASPSTRGRGTTRGRGLRGAGIKDWFKKSYSWAKDKATSLWNSNKGAVQAKALQLANQAKDKALDYAREKKLLSTAVNKILPSKYGIDNTISSIVAKKTGMGRKRRRGIGRVGRPSRPHTFRGSGFFGNLWRGVKSVGSKIVAPVAQKLIVPMAQKALTGVLGGSGRKRRVTRRRTGGAKRRTTTVRRRRLTGRGMFGSVLGGLLPF